MVGDPCVWSVVNVGRPLYLVHADECAVVTSLESVRLSGVEDPVCTVVWAPVNVLVSEALSY